MVTEIIIYGSTNCSGCTAMKNDLESRSLKYRYIDVRSDPDAYAELIGRGYTSVPIVRLIDKTGEKWYSVTDYSDRLKIISNIKRG